MVSVDEAITKSLLGNVHATMLCVAVDCFQWALGTPCAIVGVAKKAPNALPSTSKGSQKGIQIMQFPSTAGHPRVGAGDMDEVFFQGLTTATGKAIPDDDVNPVRVLWCIVPLRGPLALLARELLRPCLCSHLGSLLGSWSTSHLVLFGARAFSWRKALLGRKGMLLLRSASKCGCVQHNQGQKTESHALYEQDVKEGKRVAYLRRILLVGWHCNPSVITDGGLPVWRLLGRIGDSILAVVEGVFFKFLASTRTPCPGTPVPRVFHDSVIT